MPSPRGLIRSSFRPAAPAPDADTDADLLGQFVAARTEEAFAALVRRHGPMVHGVCHRRLGPGPDADDAFQVVFMLLARDAARIGNRESLPGWLYRVAYLVALKMSGTRARRRPAQLPEDTPGPTPDPVTDAEARELRAAVDEELAALPDKLRAVVVLCGLEGRSNADAARLLGCPTGTVDSRLSAARQRLRARLARRGWPVPAVAALDALVHTPPASALGVSALFEQTVRAAVGYAASSGAAADPLSTFANGVTTIMSPVNVKLLVAAGMSLAVFATAGLGLFGAPADDGPAAKPPAPAAAQAGPPKKDPPPKVEEPPSELAVADNGVPVLKDEQAVRRALAQPASEILNEMTLQTLLDHLHRTYGLNARIDTAAFKRLGMLGGAAMGRAGGDDRFLVAFRATAVDPEVDGVLQLYEQRIRIPTTRGMSIADLLTEALAQLPGRVTYRVRGNQVLIVPAFVPPATPGGGAGRDPDTIQLQVEYRILIEQVAGDPVSIAVEDRPLAEVLKELRRLTGSNIVLDSRCKEQAKLPVSGTFDDVRLFNVLAVLADMCDLKPAYTHNVYYVTTPVNADDKQRGYFRDLNGEPPMPQFALPPGAGGFGGVGGGVGQAGPAPPHGKP